MAMKVGVQNHLDMVHILLARHDVNTSLLNNNGRTAAEWSQRIGRNEVYCSIVKHEQKNLAAPHQLQFLNHPLLNHWLYLQLVPPFKTNVAYKAASRAISCCTSV